MANDNKLIFKDAEEARDDITKRELREIRKLYNVWAREIKEEYRLHKLTNSSDYQKSIELTKLYYNMRNASRQLSVEINSRVVNSITEISNTVVRVNQRWLNSLGLSTDKYYFKYSYAKNLAIRNIITGNLYADKKPLSERIWNIADGHDKDIYQIISMGIARNLSVYDISKQIEKYVNPSARVPWVTTVQDVNGVKKIGRIHNVKVDYNAVRLTKTMLQHSYQSTLIALTRDNPFVDGYIWHASGGHPCELCSERDGNFYTASNIPLDHPNGQCTIEVSVNQDKIENNLSSYYEEPIYYPDGYNWPS